MGFENTNRFLDELLSGDDLAAVSAMFDQVLGQGVCIRSIEGLTYSDRSYQRAEILRLPLRHRDGEQRLVIGRSEEHTSELQSLMRISYAVFCLKKKPNKYTTTVYSIKEKKR